MRALCVGNGPSSDRIPWREMARAYDVVVGVNYRIKCPLALTHWVSIHRMVDYLPHWDTCTALGVKMYVGAPEWQRDPPPYPARLFEDTRPARHPFRPRGDSSALMCCGVMMPAIHLAWNLGADELHLTGMDGEPAYSAELQMPPPAKIHTQYVDGEVVSWRIFFEHLRAHGATFAALTPTPLESLLSHQ